MNKCSMLLNFLKFEIVISMVKIPSWCTTVVEKHIWDTPSYPFRDTPLTLLQLGEVPILSLFFSAYAQVSHTHWSKMTDFKSRSSLTSVYDWLGYIREKQELHPAASGEPRKGNGSCRWSEIEGPRPRHHQLPGIACWEPRNRSSANVSCVGENDSESHRVRKVVNATTCS